MSTLPSRPLAIATFLDQHGWGEAAPQAFDGDFSPRRYARLTQADGRSALLMDADEDQKTPQFVVVDKILRGLGVAAPEIYAAEAEAGLVLLEDFGGRNVGALLDAGEAALPYYKRAAEILARIHAGFAREAALPVYDSALFTAQVDLFLDAYFPFVIERAASEEERGDFRAAWQAVLHPLERMKQSLLLRDFMPDNLMELADGRLGVLDFQDAGVGPVAYDLASLCEEVRRDGGFALLPEIVVHYRECARSEMTQAELMRACVILSAQRHMRILGILVRLALKTGRRERLAFLPRVRRHLARVLDEGYLMPVKAWVGQFENLL